MFSALIFASARRQKSFVIEDFEPSLVLVACISTILRQHPTEAFFTKRPGFYQTNVNPALLHVFRNSLCKTTSYSHLVSKFLPQLSRWSWWTALLTLSSNTVVSCKQTCKRELFSQWKEIWTNKGNKQQNDSDINRATKPLFNTEIHSKLS